MRWLLILAVLIAACKGRDDRSTLDRVLARGELLVGTEPQFPPFESRNEKGEYVGFDMDMARELAKDLGVKLRLVPMEWVSLPTALSNGEIDVIISGMTVTEERKESRDFTDPYFHTALCMLVNAKAGIEKPEDLGKRRLVVKQGTTGDVNARRLFPDAEIIKLQNEGECALDVVNGRAEAFLYDQLTVLHFHRMHPETTRALLQPLTKEPYAMAVRKGDTAFVARLNRFLEDFRSDGRYDALRKKYFSELPDEAR